MKIFTPVIKINLVRKTNSLLEAVAAKKLLKAIAELNHSKA